MIGMQATAHDVWFAFRWLRRQMASASAASKESYEVPHADNARWEQKPFHVLGKRGVCTRPCSRVASKKPGPKPEPECFGVGLDLVILCKHLLALGTTHVCVCVCVCVCMVIGSQKIKLTQHSKRQSWAQSLPRDSKFLKISTSRSALNAECTALSWRILCVPHTNRLIAESAAKQLSLVMHSSGNIAVQLARVKPSVLITAFEGVHEGAEYPEVLETLLEVSGDALTSLCNVLCFDRFCQIRMERRRRDHKAQNQVHSIRDGWSLVPGAAGSEECVAGRPVLSLCYM